NQLALSLGAIFVVVYTIMFKLHKSWFEGVFQIIQLSIKLTAKNPCEMQFDMLKKFCIIRILMTFSFPSFVCLHASITIQRVLTSLSGNRKLHLVIARCSLALTLIICVSYTVLGYRDYPLDGIGAFCPGYTKSNTGQLLPVAFFHLICFTVQYVGFQIGLSLPIPEVDYAALNGFIYMMPYYCLISPSILLLLMTIEEKNKRIELRSLSNITPEATAEVNY
ncbi:hypothetical protein PMAYCL1PPCAC_13367, partial [Pristionchus mayeri]